MRIFKEIQSLNENTSVALGLFDALHKGHQEVIKNTVKEKSLQSVVFSFEFDKEATKPQFSYIFPTSLKFKYLEEMGVDICICPKFSDIKNLSPAEFLNVLKDDFKAKALFCGEDYRFGKEAKGDITLLKSFCDENDIKLCVLPDISENGVKISSTAIRKALKDGEIPLANRLLGRNYGIDFPVTDGKKLGRTLGFPTINQVYPHGCTLPRFGVYLTKAYINGKNYYGVTNVGIKPTVTDTPLPSAETTLLDFEGDLYGEKINLEFLEFIREEKKFNSIDELKKQIETDVKKTREIINIASNL